MRPFVPASMVLLLATACAAGQEASPTKSLTAADFTGQKYYFGWGVNGDGNPELDSEVETDVDRTKGVFSSSDGGDYVADTLVDDAVSGSSIADEWDNLASKMTKSDMYLQYSSGHGDAEGLAAGVSYDDMVDAALSMPAKEVLVFTMACESGGLVDAFDDAKDRWGDYQSQGRTLFVMSSSQTDELSSSGEVGSAFGDALWRGLIGYADKPENGGNGDGIVTLDELIQYVVAETERVGGHTPTFTGDYDPKLQVTKVPTAKQAAAMLGDSRDSEDVYQQLLDDGVVR